MAFAEKGKSKLKMIAQIPGKEQSITWYSPIDQNLKENSFIIKGMIGRFKKQPAAKRVCLYQFFENGNLIHEEKP